MFRRGVRRGGEPVAAPVAGAVVLAVAVTVAVVTLPFVGAAYRAPGLRVALETMNALIALLAGYLLYGRYRPVCR